MEKTKLQYGLTNVEIQFMAYQFLLILIKFSNYVQLYELMSFKLKKNAFYFSPGLGNE